MEGVAEGLEEERGREELLVFSFYWRASLETALVCS